MSLSSVPSLLAVASAETAEHGDPAIHPYVVGAIALAILMALLVGVVAFGGGREHS